MRCPECHAIMDEGVLPIHQGLHFLRNRSGRYREFAESLPGTSAVMRANDLTAWRCRRCQLVTFAYGDRHLREMQKQAAHHPQAADADEGSDGEGEG